jgi:DNA excision repair protein ERCC-4
VNHFPADFDTTPKPTIIIDTREQTPLRFSRLPSEAGTLATADYSIKGLETHFGVERKSIPDLVACCVGDNRARFEAELTRLRGYSFRRLLIVGAREEVDMARYRSNVPPRTVWATLAAFEMRYGLPFHFEPTPDAAASRVECWAAWFYREQRRTLAAIVAEGGKQAVLAEKADHARTASR